ncbi:hypothetical protein [Rhizobium rhizophilum]|uniref:Uncharacterized protein n=1 Tax=Rhizobium rhizophilum TaxID=1850373 RepID=A0ABY2QVH7_9HYPH|nr:hypothetical protein [Rhizobium rhizophilum]THV13849.1 hypothetical protein E9677_13190 [Rhizobium rhizophilum]
MTGAQRSSGSYFKPHPKSRQAFLEECVLIWCAGDADKSPHCDDPALMDALKAEIRNNVASRLGSAPPETIDYFAGVELAAFRSQEVARYYSNKLDELLAPRPKKGNRRREVPAHLPLRPSRTVITFVAAGIKGQNPTASRNAIYSMTADHLRDGIPKSEANRRLSIKNVRDAVESHGLFDDIETIAARHRREFDRVRIKGMPHVWDCGVYDWMVLGRRLARMLDKEDGYMWPVLFEKLIAWPMGSFERCYAKARAGKRFAGLYGADLARAIHAALDLRAWVLRDLDASTAHSPKTGTRTASSAD